MPSDDDVIEDQFSDGADVCVQFKPEFADVQIPPLLTAANLVPSDDDVISFQFRDGADVSVQFKPESADV